MNERELFKQTLKEHFLDKDAIRVNAICNQPILNPDMKGKMFMKKRIVVLISAVILLCFSAVTVFAVNQMLKPREVAQILEYPLLASAFNNDSATVINKTVTQKGYNVSLLGITSGESLDNLVNDEDGSNNTAKSYAVVAISMADGTPFTDQSDTPLVSPLVKGLNPAFYNIATFNGGFRGTIDGGILYHLIECDSIEMFADKGVYLCVTSGGFGELLYAYNFDEASGTISPNNSFDGLNVLFDLPLDKSKADPKKAKDYLDGIFESKPTPDRNASAENEKDDETNSPSNEEGNLSPFPSASEVIKSGKLVEGSEKTITMDENGNYNYRLDIPGKGSMESMAQSRMILDFQKVGVPFVDMRSGNSTTYKYLIFTLQPDNSIVAGLYEFDR